MTSSTLPDGFLERVARLPNYPTDPHTYLTKPPLSIRINPAVTKEQELINQLTAAGIQTTPYPPVAHAWQTNTQDATTLTQLPAYKNGDFYIQSTSSMLPAIILNPQPGEDVLDLCAAPGSKTIQMAHMMHSTGTIVANDSSRNRLYKLHALAAIYGATNIQTVCRDGRALWQEHQDRFDKTLVDVPCSMEGRMHDEVVRTHWSMKEIKRLAKMGGWLLRSAMSATRPGGDIVFSTCTIAPEENEGVVDWILKKDGHKIELVDIATSFPGAAPGVTSWNHTEYSPEVAKARRIIPDGHHEAFFIAHFKKTTA